MNNPVYDRYVIERKLQELGFHHTVNAVIHCPIKETTLHQWRRNEGTTCNVILDIDNHDVSKCYVYIQFIDDIESLATIIDYNLLGNENN